MEECERFINANLHTIRSLMVSNTEDILALASQAGLINRAFKEEIRIQLDQPGDDPRKWFHYNSWKFPIKSRGYCDLSNICFHMRASSKTDKLAKCIKNCASSLFSYQNISAHTHVTKPETILSLAAAINELVRGLTAKSDENELFLQELDKNLKMLFEPKNNFLNQLFDTESFSNTQIIDNELITDLIKQNESLSAQVEVLEDKLTDNNTNHNGLVEELEYLKIREVDLVKVIRSKENELEKLKAESILKNDDNEILQSNEPHKSKEILNNSEYKILNSNSQNTEIIEKKDEIVSWDELFSELLTMRNRIKWSPIRPENWENILSKKIIWKFRSGEITSLNEWKTCPGVEFLYKKHQKTMDLQLEIFWEQIQDLINIYTPEMKECSKCKKLKIMEDFEDLELSHNSISENKNHLCKNCCWHKEIKLLE